ncbi:DNA methyltransferase [Alishewanella longhuensis]|uniref:site-specific DNA-methyltransferase (adenine-specific) n=1 Tax=Alishewanella longhuensis TaxID=1091037 RepID=A0ABQ3L4J9_9ALTE|nr:DNA adenine methylase [Alishewanella longhuensis]GHG73543.1 DNA methyltransferase [Alishewanella longhuensis]
MPQTPSPLRYPGGKTAIWPLVSKIITDNELSKGHYAEPYAGGGGLALSLLFKGHVHELHLNDLDRSIWSFWNAVLNRTDDFVDRIQSTDVTIEEWYRQREVQENKDIVDDFDLAFSSFFLNRTNRSGVILKAGVIGGIAQAGDYKIDCRFNKVGLVERIRRIEKYKHRIHLYNMDAVDFINESDGFLPENSIYCIDPPYFVKGSTLYTNFYEPKDHKHIADTLTALQRPWILTYDNSPHIQELYHGRRQFRFNLNYSAANKRIGTELLIVSDDVVMSNELKIISAAA